MLSLHKLEIFSTVVQAGSFSAAAERLYMTQSAVSQHIHDLEARLGTPLFKRGRRGVTLTVAGEKLHTYTQQILRLVAEAERAVTTVENLTSGHLQIGATPGVSTYLLPEWLQSFQQRYPRLTIALATDITARVVADVLDYKLDIGFVEGELTAVTDERLGQHVLCEFESFVVVGPNHPWWERDQVPLAALDGERFITRPPNSQTGIWLSQLLSENRVQPQIVGAFDNQETIKAAVIAGTGITILPGYAIALEQQRGLIRALSISDYALRRSLKLIWERRTPLTPIAAAFLRDLAESFPDLDSSIPV
ncbi:MAG: LysR family transcriptional regulator [Chloroflexi bacterium]|nr:LysR family transcriptional regulator [Chloroflexota bacterium]